MTDYQKTLLNLIEEKFSSGETSYCFSLPNNADEQEVLITALNSLESLGHILIIASPELTHDDFIEVEKFPPCCRPLTD